MANYYQKEDKTEFFRTPEWMLEKCYEMIPNAKTILDPCAGDCGLEDFTRDIEYTLLDLNPRSHIIEQADFLKWTANRHFDAAICNPPFGLKNEFLEHLFEFTDEVVYIAPLKSIINDWHDHIYDIYLDWRIPYFGFGILTSVAIFHLKKQSNGLPKEDIRRKYMMTGDESIFIARKASINNQAGDKLYRYVIYTKTKEEAEHIINIYKKNENYVRNYAYQYGNNILDIRWIPLLVKNENRKNYELF